MNHPLNAVTSRPSPFLQLLYVLAVGIFLMPSALFAAQVPDPAIQPIHEIFEPAGVHSVHHYWKVAVVQWNPPGDAPLGSVRKAKAYKAVARAIMDQKIIEAARHGAKYITLSEFAAIGYPEIPNASVEDDNYRNRDDVAPYVETVPGPTTAHFGRLAKKLKVWVQFGMAEVDPDTQVYYNAAVVLNSHGALVARHRKINLFGSEGRFVSPGNTLTTFMTPAGRFGVMVCADAYDTEVEAGYRALDVDAIAVSSSWAKQNSEMKAMQKTALATHAAILASNQNYFPDAGVIDADGHVQSHIRQSLGAIAYGYLPRK